jgi:hypothetical protein
MKNIIITGVMAAAILTAGCRKQPGPADNTTPPPKAQANTAAAAPLAQQALTAWQQGDKSAAVNAFLAADWSARPLFAAGSILNLSEDQFKALSDADRQEKSAAMMAQLASMKQLATAVVQSGRDATANGDAAQARKYFTAVNQCGAALAGPDSLKLVQLVGQAFQKMSDQELKKLGP